MVSQRDEFAEVRVRRDNHAFLYPSELEELGVGSTTSLQIGDNMDRVMAGGGQGDGDAVRQTFVDEELHALSRSGSCRSSTAAAAKRSES